MHYLLRCDNINMKIIREDFKNDITILQPQFKYFDSENMMLYCVSMSDSYLHEITAKFLKNIFNIFHLEEDKENLSIPHTCNVM